MNESSIEQELQKVFLSEAQEMLDDTETAFLAIETNPQDTTKIDKIFRLVHTIKGSAHVAGFSALGHFAHKFEYLLGIIRDGSLKVSGNVVDVLLAGNDKLKEFVNALKRDVLAEVDTFQIVSSIEELLPKAKTQEPTPLAAPTPIKEQPLFHSYDGDKNRSAPKQPTELRSILICDDDSDVLEMIKEIVELEGHRTYCELDAISALATMRKHNIDVIITDLKMPKMDGIQFIKEVREFNKYIPVIFVSGFAARENAIEFIKLGISAFVEKPFRSDDLVISVKNAVLEKKMRDAILYLSRQTFRTYVSLQTIEALVDSGASSEDRVKEKKNLERCLDEIRDVTQKILAVERTHKG